MKARNKLPSVEQITVGDEGADMPTLESGRETCITERTVLCLFFALWALNLVQHVPSFYRTHFEGDELVYFALAMHMGWDGSNYTTRDEPRIRQYPFSIYRQPLFHHGPALPYAMKIGLDFGLPATAGLLFANVAMGIFFVHLKQLMLILKIPPAWRLVAYAGTATDPLLLYSTTRLHHDAIAGLLIASGLIAFVDAQKRQSIRCALWSGLLISLALNSRFNAIVVLPVLLVFQAYSLLAGYRADGKEQQTGKSAAEWKSRLRNLREWKVFVVVAVLVGTIGLQHFYQLYSTYGTIDPRLLIVPDPGSDDPWLGLLATRSRGQMLFSLLVILPILLVFLYPKTYRSMLPDFREGTWGPAFVIAFFVFLGTTLMILFSQLRYFAIVTPLLHCCLPSLIVAIPRKVRPLIIALLAVTVFSTVTTAYPLLIVEPDSAHVIFPSLYEYLPFLAPLYGPRSL